MTPRFAFVCPHHARAKSGKRRPARMVWQEHAAHQSATQFVFPSRSAIPRRGSPAGPSVRRRPLQQLHAPSRCVPDAGVRGAYLLDARWCISYLRIELREGTPRSGRNSRRAAVWVRHLPGRLPVKREVLALRDGAGVCDAARARRPRTTDRHCGPSRHRSAQRATLRIWHRTSHRNATARGHRGRRAARGSGLRWRSREHA